MKYLIRAAASGCFLLGASAIAQPPLPASGVAIGVVQDAALTDLIGAALAEHPQVLAAEAGVDAGKALQQAASRPVFNPELDIGFESSDTNDRLIGVSQTLDIGRQRSARRAVAGGELQVAERQLAGARQELAVELLAALAEYWTARELDALGVLRLDLMQRFADVAQQRQQAGDLTQVDLNVANLARSQARIERAGASAALAEADQMLRAFASSVSAGNWPRPPTELPVLRLSEDDLDELINAVPEVRIQRDQLAVAEATVTLRERERRATPTLSVVGGEEEDESLVGLSVSVPLNVRNRFMYEVSAARASRLQIERELDNITLRARARVQGATQRYVLTREAWREWLETGAPNLAEQTELLERLWRAGELDLTEYLVQLDQTLDTQASALELQRELWLAWFEWLAAAGEVGAWLGLPVETP